MKSMHIDFIGQARSPRLGWLILGLGLGLAGLAGQRWLAWHQTQAQLTQAHEQALRDQAEHERQRLASLPPPVPPYTDDLRWQRAAHELNLPWMDTLRAIEHATRPPVYLTGFKSDPASGRLQLEAEAPDLDAALGYVSALQAERQLRNTQLQTHDSLPDPQGRSQLRFALQTQWVRAR
jgi:hypothetical protein